MLPGFRFLLAAIVLSMSILVFGLGAAALLRAAHEEFASTPPWHAAPETSFAQQSDAAPPVLAMLRVDPPVAETTSDNAPATEAPAEPTAVASTPAEPAATVALPPEDSPPPETAKPPIPVAEDPPPSEAAAVAAGPPASGDESGIATTIAAAEQAQPVANVAAATAAEPAAVPTSADADIATTTIATLGGPPVTIEPPGKAAGANPDPGIIKKRQQARRAIKHRRMVSRMAAQAAQPPANPFAPPGTAVRSH
jgi:hypothetical protein